MNILHMKYAVEVAKMGSLNKASESLYVALPNISRSIKELEADIGITIFDRTAKGMILTPQGEEFISFAKSILDRIDAVENYYKNGGDKKTKFSVSIPAAFYISEAFAQFSKCMTKENSEFYCKEANSQDTINNVLNHYCDLGIIRYAEDYDRHFKSLLDSKDLCYELVGEFSYNVMIGKDSPLASPDEVKLCDLDRYIEIAHPDPYVPYIPSEKVTQAELSDSIRRRIFVFERASQLDLLAGNPETFMWVSPTPAQVPKRYGLAIKKCTDNTRIYKDLLIYRKGYKLTAKDKQFITELCISRRKSI